MKQGIRMPLHPQAKQFLTDLEAQGLPPLETMAILEARATDANFGDVQGDLQDVSSVRDLLVPGEAGSLPVRIYNPNPGTLQPIVVYFHGGGWVVGSIDVVDKPCRELANAAQCIVASVNYRLSPETKFPGPAEDCYSAVRWFAENAQDFDADTRNLVVAGDSSGGNLAAAVCLMARDRGGPHISQQLLIYPVMSPTRDTQFDSYVENESGYLLTRDQMEWFWGNYAPSDSEARQPYASPLLAEDFAGLPRGLIVTAEFDPLRDEGLAYASALKEAGVDVRTTTYPGAIHGFFWFNGIMDQGRELVAELAGQIREETD